MSVTPTPLPNSPSELSIAAADARGIALHKDAYVAAQSEVRAKYHPHIDGLRAVAIASVVLYHAGVAAFSGGFVGVDVFFVISGYLITEILVRDIVAGRFSILAFYDRRIRRIFPALFTVLFFIPVLAWFLFPDRALKDLSDGIVATVLFLSNALFWWRYGYFNQNASTEPTIHTWSLAVEEQFYIAFPILLFLLYRGGRARAVPWLVGLALLSLGLSAWCAYHFPRAAFYLTPFRAWELLLGSLLALGVFPVFGQSWLRQAEAWIGIALIACAALLFTPQTVFPGLNALFPCVGAALLIRAEGTMPARLLSLRPVIFLGLISYSLYLWHWPLFVFAKAWNIGDLTAVQSFAVVMLSVVLAALTWHYIENPFRKRGVASQRPVVFAAAGVAIAAGFTAGILGHVNDGWPQRLPQEALRFERGLDDSSPRRKQCHDDDAHLHSYEEKCVYGAPGTVPRYAIWGDSHAVELAAALGEVAGEYGQSLVQISYSDCPPSFGDEALSGSGCRDHNNAMFQKLIADRTKKTIFLISRYREKLSEDGFRAAVTGLLAAGKKLVLIYPFPDAEDSVPNMLASAVMAGRDPKSFSISYDTYRAETEKAFSFLDSLPHTGNVMRIYPHTRLCSQTACAMSKDGVPLYFDSNHISMAGAEELKPLFEPLFESSSS
jgi:peptidoglycan/LPS O-acetylase OafA/YrhL